MTPTILVVDDTAGVREMMAAVIGTAGYNVLSAATLEEAVKVTETTELDLMVVDVRLGDHNGIELALRQRARGRTHPVLIMSGHHDPVLIAEAERLGARFLLKPINPDYLLALIEETLKNQDAG
jgi:DNA-binding NtrC family response regulator